MRHAFVATDKFRVIGLIGCAKRLKSVLHDRKLDQVGFETETVYRFPRRFSKDHFFVYSMKNNPHNLHI